MPDPNDPVTYAALPTGAIVGVADSLKALEALEAKAIAVQPAASQEHILQFFDVEHLRPDLAEVSRPFATLALTLVATVPRNPERTVALRKLLEAKDAAVRACIAK